MDSAARASISTETETTKPTSAPGLTSEIFAVIESAAAAFLGRKVRILSVALRPVSKPRSSSWTAQGRDMIHESRNLVQRGR